MTDRPFPVTYRLVSDIDALQYLTFLAHYIPIVEGKRRKPTGELKLDYLPVRFSGPSREVVEANALAFWDDETSRKQAKIERGKAVSSKRWPK